MAQAYTVFQSSDNAGGDYSTLKAAVDAVTEINSTIDITGSWTIDDTSPTMLVKGGDGLVVTATGDSATNGIPESHANGKSNAYRIRDDGSTDELIEIWDNCTFIGFEIGQTSTTTSKEIFRFADDRTLTLDSMLLYFDSRNDQQDIIYTNNKEVTINATNCVAYNAYRAFLDQYQNDNCTLNTNCCTFYDIGFDTGSTSRSGIFGMNGSGTHTWNSLNCILDVDTASYAMSDCITAGTANHDYQSCSGATELATYYTTQNTVNETGNEYDTDIEVGPGAAGKVSVIDVTGAGDEISLNLYDDSNNAALDFCQIAPDADGANSGLTMPSVDIAGNTRYAGTSGYYDCGAFSIQSAPAGGGRIMSSLANHGGLAGYGGIAGKGGGLAG